MSHQYSIEANHIYPSERGSSNIKDTLPVGSYVMAHHPLRGYYLVQAEPFVIPTKLYGDTAKNAERILNTWNTRTSSTGVLLSGEKGSGKTMLAKMLSVMGCSQYGMSTIMVNQSFCDDNFKLFIQKIDEPCLIMFDEFEKTYNDGEQEQMLTLLDGVCNSKKLFVLTCNDMHRVDGHMLNRPGRLFYHLEYEGLDSTFVQEYCDDNLNDKTQIQYVVRLNNIGKSFNFDVLQAIVEEMNRYNEGVVEALDMLNFAIEPTRDFFDLSIRDPRLTNINLHSSTTSRGVEALHDDHEVYYTGEIVKPKRGQSKQGDNSIYFDKSMLSYQSDDGNVWEFTCPDEKVVLRYERMFKAPPTLKQLLGIK